MFQKKRLNAGEIGAAAFLFTAVPQLIYICPIQSGSAIFFQVYRISS